MEKRIKILSVILILISFSLFLVSCSTLQEKAYTSQIYALDTVIDFTVYGDMDIAEKAVEAAVEEIKRLENELSISGKGDISRINSSDTDDVNINTETFDLIQDSLDISRKTDGLFDISVYPLMHLYGFDTGKYYVPSDDEINETLKLVDYKEIHLWEKSVSLGKGMKIDLGGIAKGYITGKSVEKMADNGVDSAIINSGGNVYALGLKPGGEYFTVGIQDPDKSISYFSKLKIKDRFAVTSGTYQRYFEKNGQIYHHIMNPKTGRPADSSLKSVTVIGDNGELCDAYSTALFIMGLDGTVDFYKKSRDFDFVILTEENEVYISAGIKNDFELNTGYDMTVNIVE